MKKWKDLDLIWEAFFKGDFIELVPMATPGKLLPYRFLFLSSKAYSEKVAKRYNKETWNQIQMFLDSSVK